MERSLEELETIIRRRDAASRRIETTMALRPEIRGLRAVSLVFAGCTRDPDNAERIYVITFVPFGNGFVRHAEGKMLKVTVKPEKEWSTPLTLNCCWLWMRSKKPRSEVAEANRVGRSITKSSANNQSE